MPWKPLVLFFLLASPALAATPEEQSGCPDSPDLKSAEDICSVYKKIEGYYGRYNMIVPGTGKKDVIAASEPDTCRAYYASYMHGRNVLCAYRKEAKEFATKITRASLPGRSTPLTKDQVAAIMAAGDNYKAAMAMHKKYLGLLTADEADLKKKFIPFAYAVNLTAFIGSEADGENNRKRSMFNMLNTEMNCKGGSISNIPALWWGGANFRHAKLLKELHPRIIKSVGDAKLIASDAVTHWDGLDRATVKAATSMDSGNSPKAPAVEFPEVKDELSFGHEANPLLETGGGAAIDKGTEKLVELIKFAPGPGIIIRFLVSIGYAGAVSHGQLTITDVLASGVGLVSLPANILVLAIGEVKKHDEAMRALYTLWSQKALGGNEKLKPQELSQQFCKWYADEVAKKKQVSLQEAIRQVNTPGSRIGDPGMPGSAGSTD